MQFRKFVGILLFTLVETLGVGLVWEIFFDQNKIVLASVAAFAFFTVEHIMAKNVSQGLPIFSISGSHIFKQIVLGVTEVVFWDVWRLIHERVEFPAIGPSLAIVVFAALLVLQHNAEGNTNSGAPFFSNLFRSQGVLISVIESFTAFAWLVFDNQAAATIGESNARLIALIPLFIGLLTEHFVRVFGEAKGQNV
jgi:hypothetical protein